MGTTSQSLTHSTPQFTCSYIPPLKQHEKEQRAAPGCGYKTSIRVETLPAPLFWSKKTLKTTVTSSESGTPYRRCLVEWGWWGERLGKSLKLHTVIGWNPARSPCSGWLIQACLMFASKHLHDWVKLGRRWSSSITQAFYQDNKAQEETYEDVEVSLQACGGSWGFLVLLRTNQGS